ncbi:methanogenesis marker 17 protein [Methanothermobacter sp. K4]|uniref:methanogenesis marker 17 protein n=1 Tax=Methanothermobacter sp. K4 TaxID=2913262 RepID=UPI001EDB4D30|nr:methanogenesis marker 17 protein [Methanothermobacter sp. K4]MCG2829361.1 methanogenesis marker 17 protein [Methanothermobacter sp. K4]
MGINVECYDPRGAEVYEIIARQVLQDLQLVRAVDDLRIWVDPREPVFIIAVKTQRTSEPIYLEDMAEMEVDKATGAVHLRIRDETYLPQLLERLWETQGRGRVRQPSRFEVVVEDPISDIRGMTVHDPSMNLRKRVYDAIFRIIPEGFRVIRDLSEDNIIALVCTDEVLRDEWILKAREIIDDMR